jgi:hypothetical protein
MFRSRHEWFAHELQLHRREWVCEYCNHESFATAASFSTHLKSTHPAVIKSSQLEAIVLQSEEPIDKVPATACKLCDQWEIEVRSKTRDSEKPSLDEKKTEQYSTLAKFRKHLGRHMEQLALFALPMDKGKEEDLSSEGAEDGLSDHVEEEDPVEIMGHNAQAEDEHILSENSRDDGTESEYLEDNISEAPTKQPDVRTEHSSGKIAKQPKVQSHIQSEHLKGKTTRPLTPQTRGGSVSSRMSQFFISSEGIDTEVITTDICRYLGNDALVRPGTYQVCCSV